jgi:hypothetical protein
MKKNIVFCVALLLFFCNTSFAQGVLPIHRYIYQYLLNLTPTEPSFAYSLRKLKRSYTGFAVKLRNGTNNAEGNVAFDSTDIVSDKSKITITASGTSGFAVGSVQIYATFKGAASVFVTTWYDQGANAYHAIQTTNANQPELQLNTAGTSNNKPSIFFNGSYNLNVNQPIENLVNGGIRGTFLLGLKTTANNGNTMGFIASTGGDWRWSFHFNWTDGNLYFDAGEICCAANRAYNNATSVNLWKQYTFIRGTTYKTARLSAAITALNNSAASSVARTSTGGTFGIGALINTHTPKLTGYFSEIIMFPTDFSVANVIPLETNQINFWNL